MDIDISYANEIEKRCYNCDETVLNNLNIVCSASNIILWNKFQIFLYESFEFESAAKILIPEFQIRQLIISGNYLVCLDYSGNVHTTFLKLKNTGQKYTSQKSFTYTFQPRAHSIVACSLYDNDHALCLKYESNSYFLCLHKINSEFPLLKNVILTYNEYLPLIKTNDKYIIKVLAVIETQLENLKKVFNTEDLNIRYKYNVVVVTYNKLDVYGFLFSSKMTEDHISLVKLYSCPSEISNLELTDFGELNIIIGLSIGTLIRLSLKDLTTEIVHLNCAIHKFLVINNSILYTDGISMWKAENVLSKDIKFIQFFIKHVKDFVMFGDRIICSTFMNLIYTLSIHDEGSYLKPQSVDEYCSAEKVVNNSEYLQKIMNEVEKNEILIKTLGKEKIYITALSLSNRQDIMDSIINHKVIVYENYEDAIKENTKVLLTNNFAEYFDTESFFFLVKISTTSEHKLGDILSNALGDLRIHINIATGMKLLKTTTIKVKEPIKKLNYLIPLKNKMVDTTEMNVNIKIMSNIPGALDTKQKIWTTLYRKNVVLHSQHFIKYNLSLNRQECLKNLQESLEELILQAALNQHGNLFKFDNVLRQKPALKEWVMYVRLPAQYQEVFKNRDSYKLLNSKKVAFFLQQFTLEDFLKSKSNLIFMIGNEKIKIEIYNDSFSNPLLKVSGGNINIVLNIRNFLSDLIYCVFANFGPGKEFINLSSYATVDVSIDKYFVLFISKIELCTCS